MGASLPCRHGEDDRWIIRARAPCRLFSTSQSRRDTRHTPPKQLERGAGSTVWEQHIEGPCSDGQVSLDRGLRSFVSDSWRDIRCRKRACSLDDIVHVGSLLTTDRSTGKRPPLHRSQSASNRYEDVQPVAQERLP